MRASYLEWAFTHMGFCGYYFHLSITNMAATEAPESFTVSVRTWKGLTHVCWSKEERTLRLIRDGSVRFWRAYKEDQKTPSAVFVDKSYRVDLRTHEVEKIDNMREWARWKHIRRYHKSK